MKVTFAIWPPKVGFVNSRPRHEVPLDGLTGPSLDWLVGRGKPRRRAGSTVVGVIADGMLESAWGAKCRRMLSVALRSLADGFPTWAGLWVDESDLEGQIAFRSTNGTDATRVVMGEFGAYHYGWPNTRADGIPTFRVMPYVYENEHGGLTLARGVNAKQRRYLCGGSRDVVRQDAEIAWPGWGSAPGKWNGGFNDSTSTGDESCEVYPLGMIPPLQVPTFLRGNSLGASTPALSSWKGSDAFFFSVLFENERGERSRCPIPRPPNSAWSGYDGFGYAQVDATNLTFYYDRITAINVPIGPPGTKARLLVRSTKVTIDSTTAVAFPATGELYICARIDNNTATTCELLDGNDLSLDTSPIPAEERRAIWPMRGRAMGRFDGHFLIGNLRPNPYALLCAPWDNGTVNAPVDSADLYDTARRFYVAVTPTTVTLRKVEATAVTDRTITIGDRTLRDMVDLMQTSQDTATLTHGCLYNTFEATLYVPSGTITDVDINMAVSYSTDFAAGTKVVGRDDTAVLYAYRAYPGAMPVYYMMRRIFLNVKPLAATVGATTRTVIFTGFTTNADDPAPWGAMVVPGADALERADELLRTLVTGNATWTSGQTTMTLADSTLAEHVTPGMLIYNAASKWPAAAEVESVSGAVVTMTAASTASGAGESVTFHYDTGDNYAYGASAITLAGTQTNTPDAGSEPAGIVIIEGSAAKLSDSSDNETTSVFAATCTAQSTPDSFDALETYGAVTGCPAGILSVRVAIRAKKLDTAAATSVLVAPSPYNGSTAASGIGALTYQECALAVTESAWTDLVFEIPTNPATGAAWTQSSFNALAWGPWIHVDEVTTADVTKAMVSKFTVEVLTAGAQYGYVRSFGNALPVALPWRKAYLDRFDDRPQSLIFTGASPGHAQDALNSWYVHNQRTGPADFGPLMGCADMGPFALVFYFKGRMRLWNPRTGTTHADEDYNLVTVSWSKGAISPYAICSGDLWAIACGQEGFYGTDGGESNPLISKALYDPEAPVGQRGELEYAIKRSIIAAESGTGDFAISAQVHGGVLYVRYAYSASVNREIRYDFSTNMGKSGLSELFQSDGSPFPWSTPLTLPVEVSCWVTDANGAHHYAARNDNAGTADGRVDEIDTGTEDNGAAIQPVAYTGVAIPDKPSKRQLLRARFIGTKAGTGLSLGVSRQPQWEETAAEWDEVDIPTSGADSFGRHVIPFVGRVRENRDAEQYRIMDDGSGPCPEVSRLTIDAEVNEDVT